MRLSLLLSGSFLLGAVIAVATYRKRRNERAAARAAEGFAPLHFDVSYQRMKQELARILERETI